MKCGGGRAAEKYGNSGTSPTTAGGWGRCPSVCVEHRLWLKVQELCTICALPRAVPGEEEGRLTGRNWVSGS